MTEPLFTDADLFPPAFVQPALFAETTEEPAPVTVPATPTYHGSALFAVAELFGQTTIAGV